MHESTQLKLFVNTNKQTFFFSVRIVTKQVNYVYVFDDCVRKRPINFQVKLFERVQTGNGRQIFILGYNIRLKRFPRVWCLLVNNKRLLLRYLPKNASPPHVCWLYDHEIIR